MKKYQFSMWMSLSASFVLLACCERNDTQISDVPSTKQENKAVSNNQNPTRKTAHQNDASHAATLKLDSFVTRWDGLTDEKIGGEELLEMQRDLALEAVGKLGPSPELEVFLDYLRERGAGDLQREMLTEGLRSLFAGPEAAEAREWALRYAKDRPTREALMHLAGEEFRGPGFVAFFERVAVDGCHNSQASLLAGYCTTLARTNPEAALKTYRDLGYPFRIDNTGMMLPAYLVAQGAMDAEEADRLRLPGYDAEARLMTGEWPAGGPLPRVLGYQPGRHGTGAGPGEALYLKRTDTDNGITAVWHDESHWNRYLIDHPPTLVLPPSYCWYPDGRSRGLEGRIAVVLKDAALMRA